VGVLRHQSLGDDCPGTVGIRDITSVNDQKTTPTRTGPRTSHGSTQRSAVGWGAMSMTAMHGKN